MTAIAPPSPPPPPSSPEGDEPYSMLDWPVVERARSADGTEFVLGRYKDDWMIRVGPEILMSTCMHDSEEALASIALERVANARTVLVGGLGLGYTARAVLDRVAPDAVVTVSELMPELVDWHHRHLGAIAGFPLRDPRCRVAVGDVFDTLRKSPAAFDVVLLDVDNGPRRLSQPKNQAIYSPRGIATCLAALKPNGILAVWSLAPSPSYKRKLETAGSAVEMLTVDGRAGWSAQHVVFLAKGRA